VRERDHLPGTDLGRAARQRYFLASAFRTITSANMLLDIAKLHRLIDAVRASIFADTGLKVLELAKQLSYLSANNIRGLAIPTDYYENVSIPGYPLPVNVGVVHPQEVRAFARHLLAPHKKHRLHRPSSTRKSRNALDAGCIY
jgi:anionic cell wall polymer biosynthesis LytR-Cps2A-Psr (LCP) family protein